jgi:hypothetical protein
MASNSRSIHEGKAGTEFSIALKSAGGNLYLTRGEPLMVPDIGVIDPITIDSALSDESLRPNGLSVSSIRWTSIDLPTSTVWRRIAR